MKQETTTPGTGPLKIVVVTDTYYPDINGVAFSLARLCAGLRARGHHVEIIRSGQAHGEDETTVWSWSLPGYREVKVGAPWPGYLRHRWETNRPDVVYVAIETPLGFSATSAALRLGIPVVGGYHTNFSDYLRKYGACWIGKQVWRYQKWFHNRLDRTLVPSPDARDKLAAAGFSKVGILGRGVDTELFSPAGRCDALRHEMGVTGENPIALVVSRVSSEKNIGLAIRAFTRMRQSCPDMVCIVVGDGPARPTLMRNHPDVKFPGYLTDVKLAACYASADILLFPSETETFGNVLIEGMASGLAVLSYDYAAAAWHGKDGVNLLKVRKGDEAAFLDASVRLLDPSTRNTLSAGALQTAAGLGWFGIVGELETIFREVIAK